MESRPSAAAVAPQSYCQCGLYASTSVKAAASFVRGRGSPPEAIGAVIGRVFLWGSVVECERGWRAARAYPARLYVPLGRRGRVSFLSGRAADAERLALALRASPALESGLPSPRDRTGLWTGNYPGP
jgi:hypothetical protein